MLGEGRLVQRYEYGDMPGYVDIWVDTDFAGCNRTRKSTSGGVVMWGSSCVKTWSATQDNVALSSGEAEFYGIVKGGSQGLGMKSMLGDMGVIVKVMIRTDASAAKSMATKKVMGRVRHIEVRGMWVQDKLAKKELEIMKVKGEDNLADVLTKHVSRERLDVMIGRMGYERRGAARTLP